MRLCLFVLLGFFQTATAQVPPGAVAPEDAAFNAMFAGRKVPQVTGRLLNIPADSLKNLTITYTLVTPFSQFQVKKTTTPQPDGSFTLTLDYALPYQQIWFGVGDLFFAGLYANTDLQVVLDIEKIKSGKDADDEGVQYLGADGPLTAYMNNYFRYKRPEQNQLSKKTYALATLTGDSALAKYTPIFDSLKRLTDEYADTHPSPYRWLLENEIMSDYYAQICEFYTRHTMTDALWQTVNHHKGYLVTNSSVPFYQNLRYYLFFLPNRSIYPWPTVDKMVQRIDSMEPPNRADYMKLGLSISSDLTEQKQAEEHLINSMQTDWCASVEKSEIARQTQKITEINQSLAKSAGGTSDIGLGKPLFETSFGATLYKTPEIKALDFLTKLKEIFPGKAIMIDRWATWCIPCLQEMPYAKKLEEQSKDLPVVFVYLCTIYNSTEEKWKSKVVELKQPGVHILINEKLDADLSAYFSFNGYPGYALIDKTGHYKPEANIRPSAIADKAALSVLIGK